jgi:hypothetical protein
MKKLIIQVARLDRNYLNKVIFTYKTDNDEISSGDYSATSIFYKEKVLKNTNCDILFLFPVSLPVQDFPDTDDVFLKECNALNVDEYLNGKHEELASKHPHVKENKLLVIPSIGTYRKNNNEFVFNSNIETITLHILTRLIRDYINDLDELYVDISGGQNIYNTSLLLAVNRFMPIYELYHAFERKIAAKIIYSDPIIPGTKKSNINVSDLSAKAFFEMPYKTVDDIQKLLQNRTYNIDKKIHLDFYRIYLPALFYSVKNGFILLIRQILNKINELKFSPLILEKYPLNLNIDYKESFNSYNKLFFANSIYFGIKKIFEEFPEMLEFEYLKNQSKNKVKIIGSETYESYFKKFNLSNLYNRFVSELYNTLKEIDMNKLRDMDDFTDDFLKSSYKKEKTFNTRNYFAHNGLELNSFFLKLIEETDDYIFFYIKQKEIYDKLENIIEYSSKS